MLSDAPPAASREDSGLARALDRAETEEHLSISDIRSLLNARGDDLDLVLSAASRVRERGLALAGRPGVITYSRKVFVPLTTLCRDRCHYCIFVDTPGQLRITGKPVFMSPEQVLAVVREGQRQGCKEALLTLGDRPEQRWPEARRWLSDRGFASTLEYVAHVARLITAETGMLAHLNPGVMSADELRMLRPTAPSMGMMLETTSRRLFEEPGQVHYGSPDKDPAVRLAVIDDAGAAAIPFTTGILVGIGETPDDRAESLAALRDAHARHGHLQEIIVQNFRAKPGTAMRDTPDADGIEYVATVAAARLVMGPRMRIQVPPNLSAPAEFALLVRAGADDWGGVSPVTADHVNPERPWPHLDELAAHTSALGFTLRERLTVHPEFISERWLDPEIRPAVAARADPTTGLAADPPPAAGWHARAAADGPSPRGETRSIEALIASAVESPTDLDDDDWGRLLETDGAALESLSRAADDVRRYTVGEAISIVVNRNLTSSGLRRLPESDPATFTLDDVSAIAVDADELGATELCVQGVIPGDPDGYVEIARRVTHAAAGMHLHAFRPQDVWDLADRTDADIDTAYGWLRAAGVDTVPGTGVKVLDEDVRRRVAPADLEIDRWIAAIRAAHRLGLRSTSVLFYGHVETTAHRIRHLRMLREIQSETGGFTEFVPIPLPGSAVPLVAERSALDEHRAMFATARLMLSGSIPHIQVPWPRLNPETTRALLASGADDLGGTLLDGRVRPEAGVEAGREFPLEEAARLAARLLRPLRQRSTDYGDAGRR